MSSLKLMGEASYMKELRFEYPEDLFQAGTVLRYYLQHAKIDSFFITFARLVVFPSMLNS